MWWQSSKMLPAILTSWYSCLCKTSSTMNQGWTDCTTHRVAQRWLCGFQAKLIKDPGAYAWCWGSPALGEGSRHAPRILTRPCEAHTERTQASSQFASHMRQLPWKQIPQPQDDLQTQLIWLSFDQRLSQNCPAKTILNLWPWKLRINDFFLMPEPSHFGLLQH